MERPDIKESIEYCGPGKSGYHMMASPDGVFVDASPIRCLSPNQARKFASILLGFADHAEAGGFKDGMMVGDPFPPNMPEVELG